MKRLLPLLALCGTLVTAQADLILEQQIQSAMQNGKLVTKIKGEKVRMDMPSGPIGEMSMIIDTTSGDVTNLIHAQKIAMKMPGAQTRQAMEAIRKMNPAAADAAAPKLVATGKTEAVGAYTAEIYTWEGNGVKQTLWVAKDYPNFNRIKPQIDTLSKAASSSMGANNQTPDMTKLPGMVVKSEQEFQGQKVTVTLVSVKEDPVEVSALEKPADYQDQAMPALPGAK